MDEQNLAYAPPNEAALVPSPTRRELFARPSALAGALLLTHCLFRVAMPLIRYASFGVAPGWFSFVETTALAALGVGLICSDRRYLPQLALASITASAVASVFGGRVDHAGRPPAFATMLLLGQVAMVLIILLPFALLLLGRPTSLRRRFALGIFGLYALLMVSAGLMTVQSAVFVKNHPPATLNDGSGIDRPQ